VVADATGKLIYDWPYDAGLYHYQLAAGWGSAMAQGLFLSTVARVYTRSEPADQARLAALAKRLQNPLQHHLSEGGLQSHLCYRGECHVWFAEYPVEPQEYTLNGFMFTLQGLRDWAYVSGDSEATALFQAGLVTLAKALPLFDSAPFSTYDLAHLSWGAWKIKPNYLSGYHATHCAQLRDIADETRDERWRCVADVWNEKYLGKEVDLAARCRGQFPNAWWAEIPYDDRLAAAH
jgi:hypothetical protein